jgi:hypothetical protein
VIGSEIYPHVEAKLTTACLKGGEGMNASHVATGGITALLATVLVYLSHWPVQPLDLSTASAFAGLLVAAGAGLVKLYKSRTAPTGRLVVPEVPMASAAPSSVVRKAHTAEELSPKFGDGLKDQAAA